jgi:acetyl esterase/lipase
LKLLIATVPPLADHHQYTQALDSPWPSYSEFSHIPTLGWDRMNFFRKHVFPPETLPAILETYPPWWISPLRAPDFTGLCDTFVATAECDVLRDEGEAYGKKLLEAGNKVTFRR